MGICDVESLLYIQEAHLDKFRQKLTSPSATTNVAQAIVNTNVGRNACLSRFHHYFHGRSRSTRGKRRRHKLIPQEIHLHVNYVTSIDIL